MPFLSQFSVLFSLLQLIKQRLRESLQDVCELVKDGILGVVNPGVVEDFLDIIFEHISSLVGASVQVLLDLLQPHRVQDHVVVVRSLLRTDSSSEWPGILMVIQGFEDVRALLLKRLLFGALCLVVRLLGPSSLEKPSDLVELKVPAFIFGEVELGVDLLVDDLVNLADDEVALHFNRVADVLVVDSFVDFALHHRRAGVVLNVPFEPGFSHLVMLGEPLFAEILDSIVISIGHEVLDSNRLGMGFQPVHQAGSVSFDLL